MILVVLVVAFIAAGAPAQNLSGCVRLAKISKSFIAGKEQAEHILPSDFCIYSHRPGLVMHWNLSADKCPNDTRKPEYYRPYQQLVDFCAPVLFVSCSDLSLELTYNTSSSSLA